MVRDPPFHFEERGDAGPVLTQLDQLLPIGSRAGVRAALGCPSTHNNTHQVSQRTALDFAHVLLIPKLRRKLCFRPSQKFFLSRNKNLIFYMRKSVNFVQIVPNIFNEELQGQIIYFLHLSCKLFFSLRFSDRLNKNISLRLFPPKPKS